MDGKLLITKLNNYVVGALQDEKGKFLEIHCHHENTSTIIGNVYIGKVKNIAKNISAAFIEFDNQRIGYYDLRENSNPIIINRRNADAITVGDELIVQVIKEGVKKKEPVLSSNIEMVGKFCILTLNGKTISFSKKFTDNKKKDIIREHIKDLSIEGLGIIIRTNASNASVEEIIDEVNKLKIKLNEILENAQYRTCFSILSKAPEEYISLIRDLYGHNIGRIITDDKETYNNIKEYLPQEDIDKLEFYEDDLLPLYKLYNIEKCLHNVTKEYVWLKSGAYLVIQPTEALVVIDVNSGKNSSNKRVDKQFMKINLEAAKEIAIQIRLRNLSGIIIIDFINMKCQEDKDLLLQEFEKHLMKDRIKTTLVDMTKLNLVEVTRKKVRKPIYEQLKNEEDVIYG